MSESMWKNERRDRLSQRERRVPLSLSFLDDAIRGLWPKTLAVLAAATGVGKTELAILIALGAAECGKRALLYALEAERYEIHRRIKYLFFVDYIMENRPNLPPIPDGVRLTYFDWCSGKLDDIFSTVEDEIMSKLETEVDPYLTIITPEAPMAVEDMTRFDVDWADFDLIIIDHLHFLEGLHNETENDTLTRAVKELRRFVNRNEKPVVLFSHLRKSTKFDKSVVPTLEELHGSSEISKQANYVVTFAKAYQAPDSNGQMVDVPAGSTFLRIAKARSGAPGCQQVVAMVKFDLTRNRYSEEYRVFLTDKWAETLRPLDRLSSWMRGAKR